MGSTDDSLFQKYDAIGQGYIHPIKQMVIDQAMVTENERKEEIALWRFHFFLLVVS